jgi:hypothetical protein
MSDSTDSTPHWSDAWLEHGHGVVADTPALSEAHGTVDTTSEAVSDAIATTDTAHAPKVKKESKPSKMMMKMKEWVHSMTAPLTQPVKDVISKIRGRTMGLVDRMKAGEHLSWKEIMAIVAIIPGASLILGAHYANMFSQKAQAAIESGKKKWEGFLHSLGLGDHATVADIAHAESAHASAPTHPESPHMKTLETVPTAANDDHHEVTSDTPHAEEVHTRAA